MPVTINQFGKAIVAAGVMSADDVKSLWSALPAAGRPKDGETFADFLVQQGKLTDFQSQELLSGSGAPLVLGDYVLLSRIGAGGMGQVFKAQHRHMERLVAIKLLPAAMTKDEAAVKRFQREVKAAAKLAHNNIVQAYDAGVQRGVWYLVMEYVEGRDLLGHRQRAWSVLGARGRRLHPASGSRPRLRPRRRRYPSRHQAGQFVVG
ncbi:MAG: protein kinase [Pirellulales bacterium]